MTLEFFVSGEPAGQERHRTRVIGAGTTAKGKKKYFVQSYHPKASKCSTWREAVAHMAQVKMRTIGWRKLEGPLKATLIFTFKAPKKPKHPFWVMTKPDTDNLQKAILDALNDIAYADDSTIVDIQACKRYDAVPGVHIKLTELEAQ